MNGFCGNEWDAVQLEHCCRLDGSVSKLNVIRRNRKNSVLIRAENILPQSELVAECRDRKLPSRLANLNPTQARTFEQILSGKSISAIAEEEGVSRSAIYSRIRGSHGRGGMIHKNLWALLWWKFISREGKS